MNNDYYNKYIKYKNKYLKLKNIVGGTLFKLPNDDSLSNNDILMKILPFGYAKHINFCFDKYLIMENPGCEYYLNLSLDGTNNFSIINKLDVIKDIEFKNLFRYGENTITIKVNDNPVNNIKFSFDFVLLEYYFNIFRNLTDMMQDKFELGNIKNTDKEKDKDLFKQFIQKHFIFFDSPNDIKINNDPTLLINKYIFMGKFKDFLNIVYKDYKSEKDDIKKDLLKIYLNEKNIVDFNDFITSQTVYFNSNIHMKHEQPEDIINCVIKDFDNKYKDTNILDKENTVKIQKTKINNIISTEVKNFVRYRNFVKMCKNYSLISGCLKELSYVKNDIYKNLQNNDISLIFFLTFFQKKLFIKKGTKGSYIKNLLPINILHQINNLLDDSTVKSKSKLLEKITKDTLLPNIYKWGYSDYKLSNFPDCFETGFFTFLKLLTWNGTRFDSSFIPKLKPEMKTFLDALENYDSPQIRKNFNEIISNIPELKYIYLRTNENGDKYEIKTSGDSWIDMLNYFIDTKIKIDIPNKLSRSSSTNSSDSDLSDRSSVSSRSSTNLMSDESDIEYVISNSIFIRHFLEFKENDEEDKKNYKNIFTTNPLIDKINFVKVENIDKIIITINNKEGTPIRGNIIISLKSGHTSIENNISEGTLDLYNYNYKLFIAILSNNIQYIKYCVLNIKFLMEKELELANLSYYIPFLLCNMYLLNSTFKTINEFSIENALHLITLDINLDIKNVNNRKYESIEKFNNLLCKIHETYPNAIKIILNSNNLLYFKWFIDYDWLQIFFDNKTSKPLLHEIQITHFNIFTQFLNQYKKYLTCESLEKFLFLYKDIWFSDDTPCLINLVNPLIIILELVEDSLILNLYNEMTTHKKNIEKEVLENDINESFFSDIESKFKKINMFIEIVELELKKRKLLV